MPGVGTVLVKHIRTIKDTNMMSSRTKTGQGRAEDLIASHVTVRVQSGPIRQTAGYRQETRFPGHAWDRFGLRAARLCQPNKAMAPAIAIR